MIRSIPTTYGSRKYRSRTEARWAIFFDAMDIRFDYEPEGFLIRSGCYLPDFRLLEIHNGIGSTYFEVKGQEPTAEECAKCAELSRAAQCDVLLAIGGPEERFQLLWFDREGEREDRYVLAQDQIAACGFWLVAEAHANHIGPNRALTLPRGPMLSGAIEEAYALAGSASFGQRWALKTTRQPALHHAPDRRPSHFVEHDPA